MGTSGIYEPARRCRNAGDMTNYDLANGQMLKSIEKALKEFHDQTGFVVSSIKLEYDGLIYEIESTEYFNKRMKRLHTRRENAKGKKF